VLGRFLFRWRGVIGVLAFGVVFWLARPTVGSCLLGLPFLLVGLAVRFWASGYIGIEGRVREIGMRSEKRGARMEEGGAQRSRIVTGPYRILRHPLYIGNFLLVAGMLLALHPPIWLSAVVMVGFIAEYAAIVAAEEAYLAGRGGNADCKTQRAEVAVRGSGESGVGSGEIDRSQKSESRRQKAEVRTANGERREAMDESFVMSRALVEWRTWVVTGAGWGLAIARAVVVD